MPFTKLTLEQFGEIEKIIKSRIGFIWVSYYDLGLEDTLEADEQEQIHEIG